MKNNKVLNTKIVFLSLFMLSFTIQSTLCKDPKQTGIGFVWGGAEEATILNYPYVQFGQAHFFWKDVQPGENEYNWKEMDATLKHYHDLGKKVPIQVNTPCPEWIFNYVASVGTSRGGNAPQYWDPIYLDFLNKFIKAYAEHLGNSPYKDCVLFVRMQYNALNTEIISFNSTNLKGTASPDRTKWILPKNGHIYAPDLTSATETEMIIKITEFYLHAFFPYNIPVALRMNGESDLTKPERGVDGKAIYDRWTSNPLAWTMTTHYGIGLIASPESFRFKKLCREGITTGFAEQFSRITLGKGNFPEEVMAKKMRQPWLPENGVGEWKFCELSPEQSFYWTMLMMLDWGVSYISVYGTDLLWANQNPNLVRVMKFVNKYAGWGNDPKNSPGAWTALGLFKGKGPGKNVWESNVNWGFFISQDNAETTTDPVYFASDKSSIEGVWARRIKTTAKFNLNSEFAASIVGKSFLRICWLNESGAALRLSIGAKVITILKSDNSGQWKDVWTDIDTDVLKKEKIILEPIQGKPAVHLLELTRKK